MVLYHDSNFLHLFFLISKRELHLKQTMRFTILLLLIMNIWCGTLYAQKRRPFNGILLELDGKPINRARVYVRTPKDYSLTNKKGEFGLTDIAPTDTLKILIKKKIFSIPVEGRRSMIIRLADEKKFNVEEDERLISLGFSFVPRRERTVPGNFISGDDLRRSGANTLLAALQGRVPGLNIEGSHGNEEVNIRGTRTIMGNSTPLYFIDDIKVPSFEGLNLNDIDYVEIMKEASAYGSEGSNGAIIVHTYLSK